MINFLVSKAENLFCVVTGALQLAIVLGLFGFVSVANSNPSAASAEQVTVTASAIR